MVKAFILICFLSLSLALYSETRDKELVNIPPVTFKENKGQIGDQFSKPRPDVLFTGYSGDLVFHLRNNGISYQIHHLDKKQPDNIELKEFSNKGLKKNLDKITIYRLDINWLNINSNVKVLKENELPGYDNYYNEVCPNGVTQVKSYKNVTYKNLYNGIDLKWYEESGDLKYDYVISPRCDYKQIQLEIKGEEEISISQSGELLIKTPFGIIKEKAPLVTQEGKVLKSKWVMKKNIISFEVSDINKEKSFVIDPLVRLWGTYFGGTGKDNISHIDSDTLGNIYFTGETLSANYIATTGAHQTILGSSNDFNWGDAFLSKFSSAGANIWTTYYGGTGNDAGSGCDVNLAGNKIVMVGVTSSSLAGVIATPGSYQTNYGGTNIQVGDGFLALFDSNGIRQWGTYYGGPGGEWMEGVCIDNVTNDIYCGGATTSSTGIATMGSHQTIYNLGDYDAFFVKFNASGSRLWATYYGGTGEDWISSCQTDKSGNLYLVGAGTSSTNISSPNSHQPTYAGGSFYGDGFIAKFSPEGTRIWATYYGGADDDWMSNCVISSEGHIYIAGTTSPLSTNGVSTIGAHQSIYGGGSSDAFLVKFDPLGVRQWCTLYGGNGGDIYNSCGIDQLGNVYLTGTTNSIGDNVISTFCAYQQSLTPNSNDIYLVKFNPSGQRLWGTYYGGFGTETGAVCTADYLGNIYVAGYVTASNPSVMTTPGAYQTTYRGGGYDVFISKFDGCTPILPPNTTSNSALTICKGDSTILTTSSLCDVKWYNVPIGGSPISNTSVFHTPELSTDTTFYVSEGSCGSNTVRTAITITVNTLPLISIELSNKILCYNSEVNAKALGAISYTWYPEKWISCSNCSNPLLSPLETIEYCIEGQDNNGCKGKTCTTIEVNFAQDHNFSLPNAFTPNNDGINDSFCLQGWDLCIEAFLIRVFDRWGEKVFESEDPNFCWNGIYKGQLLSADVFVYSVSAKYKDDTKINKKGNITLIR